MRERKNTFKNVSILFTHPNSKVKNDPRKMEPTFLKIEFLIICL